MKLSIEINDELLHKAIGDQLQATVSRLVHEKIEEKVESIMDTKLERVDGVLKKVVDAVVVKHLQSKSKWNDPSGLEGYINAAVLVAVKDKLK